MGGGGGLGLGLVRGFEVGRWEGECRFITGCEPPERKEVEYEI